MSLYAFNFDPSYLKISDQEKAKGLLRKGVNRPKAASKSP